MPVADVDVNSRAAPWRRSTGRGRFSGAPVTMLLTCRRSRSCRARISPLERVPAIGLHRFEGFPLSTVRPMADQNFKTGPESFLTSAQSSRGVHFRNAALASLDWAAIDSCASAPRLLRSQRCMSLLPNGRDAALNSLSLIEEPSIPASPRCCRAGARRADSRRDLRLTQRAASSLARRSLPTRDPFGGSLLSCRYARSGIALCHQRS